MCNYPCIVLNVGNLESGNLESGLGITKQHAGSTRHLESRMFEWNTPLPL